MKRGKRVSNFGLPNRKIKLLSQNSRGQFYIIAAIIIIAVLIGFATYVNYAKTKKDKTKVYDLGKELKLETGYVYDYGIFNKTDINYLINDWTDRYLNYTLGQEVIEKWVFVYGDSSNLRAVVFFARETGSIGIGGSQITITEMTKITSDIGPAEGSINVNFQGFSYDFDLKEGENFFFIISSEGYIAGVDEG